MGTTNVFREKVFSGQAANGRSTSVHTIGNRVGVIVSGVFDGGTITVQAKDPNGTWVDFDSSVVPAITGPAVLTFEAPPLNGIALKLTGTAGGAASIDAWIID